MKRFSDLPSSSANDKTRRRRFIGFVFLFSLASAGYFFLHYYAIEADAAQYDMRLPSDFAKLYPLFDKKQKPQKGEWLASHTEFGQTYQDYLRCGAAKPNASRSALYVLPFGDFSKEQDQVVDKLVAFIGKYYGLPSKRLPPISLKGVPADAIFKRTPPKNDQYISGFFISEIEKMKKPDDAYAVIGVVAEDITPGSGWNFVYGEARIGKQAAICSFARLFPNKDEKPATPKELRRSLQVISHEIGHLFGMEHCIWRACNMSGCNNLAEVERQPLDFCPMCDAKICFAVGVNPAKRFADLEAFCNENELTDDANLFEKERKLFRRSEERPSSR